MFAKILIANRGEIACRVIKTCRRLGVRTVAVFSSADVGARHVRLSDEAVCIGPPAAKDSYLSVERIVAAALASGAEAIHPGYGFLSENAEFAAATAAAGMVFIGPPVRAIQAMGSKSAAKRLMQQAGVPLVPGYHGDEQDLAVLRREADAIGYPVLIKAAAGGGGRGMRIVAAANDLAESLLACQREALASFGDDRVLLEKYLVLARHIEVQVFGDRHGAIVSLHERDCSAQRRHQKVLEEAPAPGIDAEQRDAMAAAARNAARAVGYVGAGTVEFIVDAGGNFYFMEMNTRLQVEHPVTELIAGLDLVEWQLQVAAGGALPLRQEDIIARGHAIEVRLYAEDPDRGFLPSAGRLVHLRFPPESAHLRIDSGVEEGDEVPPHYDPMIAKLIVWDATRSDALRRLVQALRDVQIVGVATNVGFLGRLVAHPEFAAARIDTDFIARCLPELSSAAAVPFAVLAAAALWTLVQDQGDAQSPWSRTDGWRVNGTLTRVLEFRLGTTLASLSVQYAAGGYVIDGRPLRVDSRDGSRMRFSDSGRQTHADVVDCRDLRHVFLDGEHYVLTVVDQGARAAAGADTHGGLLAPMSGVIVALPATPGERSLTGAPLVVMEAMKMEHVLRAPTNGIVRGFRCRVGGQVAEGDELVDFEADAG